MFLAYRGVIGGDVIVLARGGAESAIGLASTGRACDALDTAGGVGMLVARSDCKARHVL